jgi:hypothetical protein
MNKVFLAILLVISGLTTGLQAKEGMYLPYLLQKINAPEMEAMGMQISPEEIYSINHSSLKDAIVHFGGGCTAEIVSYQGLLLTNHHCGYRSIQSHSSVEHDYLTDGFWAKTLSDELPNKGLTATILQSMQDVTEAVLEGVTKGMTEQQRAAKIRANSQNLIQSHDPGRFRKVEIKAFYYGNQYILMVSKVFRDVRLVGAPPSNIGKFGGDTDNWMWPRHTGDFSVFRIYADNENKPADYSKDNKPYQPPKALEISLDGYGEGDFTFVFGYPGRTQEYLPSVGVALITEKINPFKINLRRKKLDIMAGYMNSDKKIRIQYSAKYAGVANGWKKWIGEDNGIKRLGTIERKRKEEKEFTDWADVNMPSAANIPGDFTGYYKQLEPWEMGYQYFVEAGYYQDVLRYASQYIALVHLCENKDTKKEDIDKKTNDLKNTIEGFYKDFDANVEHDLLVATLSAYRNFPYNNVQKPEILNLIDKKFKGDETAFADYIQKKSIFFDKKKLTDFLEGFRCGQYKKLLKDPVYMLADSYWKNYRANIYPNLMKYQKQIDSLQRIYMQALLKMHSDEYLFPDANSTLRVSYGRVEHYEPRDAVVYKYYTTLKGIMEKENPEIYDYVVEPKLKKLYEMKDYDRYGDKDGSMHVCFIASNHTTGGNSGSPVLNAKGQLIGLNFDRNWEGTMSDLNYDPDQCRNIILDVRYCLFIIDKYADANRLIEEMNIK